MAIDRPTFHEAWYRVAALQPRLRSTVQTKRQHYRGRLWHVVADPANNSFYRLDDAAYQFIGMLDGHRSVNEAWSACQEQLGDRAPTQGEAIRLLGQLYTSNLLQAELAGDAAGMFERHRKRKSQEVRGYLMNILFVRLPLLDPDAMLERWMPLYGWIFKKWGVALWGVLLVMGIMSVAGRYGELFNSAAGVLDPNNLVWLYLSFAGIKLVHEAGHACAAKKFGHEECGGEHGSHTGGAGEVHAMGIMLLMMMPVPYVDATSAWALRNKWRRMFVGAAGMYVELAVASIAAMVWANTSSGSAIHAIAYNVMFIASLTTLLFNANPLLRYDGYYILSDMLEMPNMAQRGKEYVYYLVKKKVYGVRRARNPAHGRDERGWLLGYGVLSACYRVFVSMSILLFVADKLFIAGVVMGFAAVYGWLIKPIGRWVHYLSTSPELQRNRQRAIVSTAALAAVVLLMASVVQLPDRDQAIGVIEPRHLATVHMQADGFVESVLPSGTAVEPREETLVAAENMELQTRRRELVARKELAETQKRAASIDERALAQSLGKQVVALDSQIARLDEQLAMLQVKAPFVGTWVVRDASKLLGAYLRRGEEIGVIATIDDLVIRVAADQHLGPRIEPELGVGGAVQLRVKGRPDIEFRGTITKILPAGQKRLPSPALGYLAGGSIRVDGADEQGTKAMEPFFEIHIEPTPESVASLDLFSGQRVMVRFDLPSRPLLSQGWRTLRQLVQRRFQI